MNWLLFSYLVIGYMEAFNRCMRMELKGKPLNLTMTSIVIVIYLMAWPILYLLDTAAESLFHIAYKLKAKTSVKENSDN